MSTTVLKDIGLNLKAARKRAGLKQTDLKVKSGVTYRHYQSIEAGRINMSVLTLCRLAKALHTTVAELTLGKC